MTMYISMDKSKIDLQILLASVFAKDFDHHILNFRTFARQ